MSDYTKLFRSILTSSVWQENDATRIVWITMLALKDRDGLVEASLPGLARAAGVERTACERALAVLSAPDRDSRTKDHEGRRVREVDGGWLVINHDKYQDKGSAEEHRTKAAERQRRKRERDAARASQAAAVTRDVTLGHAASRGVTPIATSALLSSAATQTQSESQTRAGARDTHTGDETPSLTTEPGRWGAWLLWRIEAGKADDVGANRPHLETAWQAVERDLAAKMREHPATSFARLCKSYLAWPDDKPLPGGKAPPRGDRPASWLPSGVYQLAAHLGVNGSPAPLTPAEEVARRKALAAQRDARTA